MEAKRSSDDSRDQQRSNRLLWFPIISVFILFILLKLNNTCIPRSRPWRWNHRLLPHCLSQPEPPLLLLVAWAGLTGCSRPRVSMNQGKVVGSRYGMFGALTALAHFHFLGFQVLFYAYRDLLMFFI